jgi:hypothetical protein
LEDPYEERERERDSNRKKVALGRKEGRDKLKW